VGVDAANPVLDRALKKYHSRSERGFLDFGEVLAKDQVNPVTDPEQSQNPKRPLSFSSNGYSIFENAPARS
jgi:hypothetical protein